MCHNQGVTVKTIAFTAALIISFVFPLGLTAQGVDGPPSWAYPMNPPGFKPSPDDGTLRRVPGSTATYTLSQARNLFATPDWHPQDHVAMPEVVSQGRKPGVQACGVCHRAAGTGGPENSSLAGLPADYIVQQMRDYKSGARTTSVPNRIPAKLMMSLSQQVTDADVDEAAKYFASLQFKPIIKVRESATVPKTQVSAWYLVATATGETEPIGERIIELAENLEQFVSRDSRVTFVAYVPVGSIEKGRNLATTGGGGKTIACASCHGPDLKGQASVPGIAGRPPTYAFRQLYEFKHGTRAGKESALMRPSVEKLTNEDMIALVAYAASLPP
jgi:cytochrome c553